MGPASGRIAAGLSDDRHRVCGTECSGRARHNRVTCPPAPLRHRSRRDRKSKAQQGYQHQRRFARPYPCSAAHGCRERRIAGVGSGCSEPSVVRPWKAAAEKAAP